MTDRHIQKNSYPLRLPDDLRERANEEAKKNNRSLNAEIITVLKNHYEALGNPTRLKEFDQNSQGLPVTQETAEILLAQIKELINVAKAPKNKNK